MGLSLNTEKQYFMQEDNGVIKYQEKKVRSKNFILKQFKDKSNKQFSNTQELRKHNSPKNVNKVLEAEVQPNDRMEIV